MGTAAEADLTGLPDIREPMVPARYRVAAKSQETDDTWTLELEPLDDEAQTAFAPGQFNMIYAFGIGESAISISGDRLGRGPLVHTVRAVGAVTEAICRAETGDVLGVRGPYGSAWPVEAARAQDALVVAGGVGLAPLRPILYELLARRGEFRRAVLLYGGRSPDQLLYDEQLREWIEGDRLEVHVTVDTATRGWLGGVGVVTGLIDRAGIDAERTVAFVCGPELMMSFTAAALIERRLLPANLYVSLERNMKCAVGRCGHCQFGPTFICRDGPVFAYSAVERWLRIREL
jgi:NAD(P)H-flavin reductase